MLLNPNTSQAATAVMLAAARWVVPEGVVLVGHTLTEGAPLIADAQGLAQAAEAVTAAVPSLMPTGVDGLIVAGFGDPGLDRLQRVYGPLVTGLGEAGIRAAAAGGRRYAIVTVTPALHDSLVQAAHRHAAASLLAGIYYTAGPPEDLVHTPQALTDALRQACEMAIGVDGAESIVIGGGPLAAAADDLSQQLTVPVVNPVRAAVCLACARLGLSV